MAFKKINLSRICVLSAYALLAGVFSVVILPTAIHARNIDYVSDLIVNSAPAASTNHSIQFKTLVAIPPSGKIILTPQNGSFSIPPSFDYTDIDFATSSSLNGPYTDRSLATTPSATEDGVSVISGSAGSITLTLQSGLGIPANGYIQIELGANATFESVGDQRIINPSAVGSYGFSLEVRDASNAVIGTGKTLLAIINPVRVSATSTGDIFPPVFFNGRPTGTLPAGTGAVELSIESDENATCRYTTSSGIAYGSIVDQFSDTGGTFHAANIFGLTPGTFTFNIRCIDSNANTNASDTPITFDVLPVIPPAPPPAPPAAPPSAGGSPAFSMFPPLPPTPQIVLRGYGYPSGDVTVLRDGTLLLSIKATPSGIFEALVQNITQGTYVLGIRGVDIDGRKSLVFNSTITVIGGTTNSIFDIFLHPTIELSADTITSGDLLIARGSTMPSSTVEIWMYPKTLTAVNENTARIRRVSSNNRGAWEATLDTAGLENGTYAVKARATLSSGTVPKIQSNFGPLLYFGIGGKPEADTAGRSDINGDGKVNLIDFSILLFNWNSANPDSDINQDGKVSLTDFSILLFRWTG